MINIFFLTETTKFYEENYEVSLCPELSFLFIIIEVRNCEADPIKIKENKEFLLNALSVLKTWCLSHNIGVEQNKDLPHNSHLQPNLTNCVLKPTKNGWI